MGICRVMTLLIAVPILVVVVVTIFVGINVALHQSKEERDFHSPRPLSNSTLVEHIDYVGVPTLIIAVLAGEVIGVTIAVCLILALLRSSDESDVQTPLPTSNSTVGVYVRGTMVTRDTLYESREAGKHNYNGNISGSDCNSSCAGCINLCCRNSRWYHLSTGTLKCTQPWPQSFITTLSVQLYHWGIHQVYRMLVSNTLDLEMQSLVLHEMLF